MKVFIVGCGRSGTHWLAHCLDSHPQFTALIEKQPIFGMATQMAWDPALIHSHIADLVTLHQREHDEVRPRHLVDKSHANLWLVEHLVAHMPDARFVAIRRGLFGTVASMMKHTGVLSHFKRWDDAPSPNRFLGVNDVAAYRRLTLEERCAHRVIASAVEIERLNADFSRAMHVIEYENALSDPLCEATRLANFLGVVDVFKFPVSSEDQRDKWREALSGDQIERIARHADAMNASHLLER